MEKFANVFLLASVICVILAVVGSFSFDIWLASTQWVLIAGVLGIYALFFKIK